MGRMQDAQPDRWEARCHPSCRCGSLLGQIHRLGQIILMEEGHPSHLQTHLHCPPQGWLAAALAPHQLPPAPIERTAERSLLLQRHWPAGQTKPLLVMPTVKTQFLSSADMQLICTRDCIEIIKGDVALAAAKRAAGQRPCHRSRQAHYTGDPKQLPVVDGSRTCVPNQNLVWLRARAVSLPHIQNDDHMLSFVALYRSAP